MPKTLHSSRSSVRSLTPNLVVHPCRPRSIRFGSWVASLVFSVSRCPRHVTFGNTTAGPTDILFCFLVHFVCFFGVSSSFPTGQLLTARLLHILRPQRPQHHDLLETTVRCASQLHCHPGPMLLQTLPNIPSATGTKSYERLVESLILAAPFTACCCYPYEVFLRSNLHQSLHKWVLERN